MVNPPNNDATKPVGLYRHLCIAWLGGACYALGNIGYGLWPLALVCLLPLWYSVLSISLKQWRQTLGTGITFGLGIYVVGFRWLLELTDQFVEEGPVAYLLWGLTGLLFAAGYGLYACAIQLLRRVRLPLWATLCLPLLLMEWWQINLFPAYLGLGLIEQSTLSQLARLGGPLLLSAFVLWVNYLLYRILLNGPGKTRYRYLFLLPVPFLLCSFLVSTPSQFPSGADPSDMLKVGVIQNNVVKLEADLQKRLSHQKNLELSRELLNSQALDLLIWPESSYGRALRRPLPLDAQFIRQDIATPLLFGGTSNWHHPEQGRAVSANSIFLANQKGSVAQVYDKQHLIPFAESVPFIDQLDALQTDYINLLQQYFPWHQSFRPGPNSGVIQLGTFRIATPICYEMILPDYVRKMVNGGQANLMVSIANDAWFGESQEPWIHLALSRLRAIEHGLWVVRATNSGISAVINPKGEVVARTSLFTEETLAAQVFANNARTFYSLFGNWVGGLSLAILLGLLIRSRLQERSLQGLPARSHH